MHHGPITCNWVRYPSRAALARAYGLTQQTLSFRLSRGMTPEEAVAKPAGAKRSGRPGQPVVCSGVTYESIRALAKAHGMNRQTLYSRLQIGMTPEDAVSKPLAVRAKAERRMVRRRPLSERLSTQTKLCNRCHEVRPFSDFTTIDVGRSRDGHMGTCQPCVIEGRQIDQWGRSFKMESCEICGTDGVERSESLCVDHNHETGEIRGILCRQCNVGIGNLRDSSRLLQLAAAYLDERGGSD